MKIDKKRYFEKFYNKPSKKYKPNNKFKNDEQNVIDLFIEKSSTNENNEVELYNIKVTPKILKDQRFMSAKTAKGQLPLRNEEIERFPGKAPIDPKKLEQHSREAEIGKGVKHPLYAEKLKKKEQKYDFAQQQAARAEILLTEDQGHV